jgi:site-specific DNA-methyltransferase (adenine-specific)
MKPYYEDEAVQIWHGDCREVMPTLGKVDLVLTDPPYGTGGWRREQSGNGSSPIASLVKEEWDIGAVDWIDGSLPVISFWPSSATVRLLTRAVEVGLTKHRALYMQKRDPKPQVAGRIMWSVEPIWVLSQEGFLLHGGTDWYTDSTPRLGRDEDATGHPYQKPIEVMRWLIGKTTGIIVDPFMGSGTTLRAAKDLGRRAIGIETEERYCEIAAKRMSQIVMSL